MRPQQARPAAVKALKAITVQGRSLSSALPEQLDKVADKERALCQEICYGVMRFYPRLEAIAKQLLQKPLKQKDEDVRLLLLIGLYQIAYMRVADHAAVTETVSATQALRKPWARGLINATLRRFLREREAIEKAVDGNESSRYAHPQWFIDRLKADYPQQWQSILEANNQRPPMSLRVNQQQHTRDAYLQRLNANGITAQETPHTEQGITLEKAVNVEQLPGFAEGHVSVQDGAAQLAAQLLDAQAGERILDACAAPGGKLVHLLERQKGIQAIAVEMDEERSQRIHENLQRLQLQAEVITADASDTESWWDGQPFDRILLDAPCSATGVIRRHPDIKQLRRDEDIESLSQLQAQLLNALWPLLKPGGILLYATCSILAQENHLQLEHFLRRHKDVSACPDPDAEGDPFWGHRCTIGRQILPGEDGMDGFYYACLQKNH